MEPVIETVIADHASVSTFSFTVVYLALDFALYASPAEPSEMDRKGQEKYCGQYRSKMQPEK